MRKGNSLVTSSWDCSDHIALIARQNGTLIYDTVTGESIGNLPECAQTQFIEQVEAHPRLPGVFFALTKEWFSVWDCMSVRMLASRQCPSLSCGGWSTNGSMVLLATAGGVTMFSFAYTHVVGTRRVRVPLNIRPFDVHRMEKLKRAELALAGRLTTSTFPLTIGYIQPHPATLAELPLAPLDDIIFEVLTPINPCGPEIIDESDDDEYDRDAEHEVLNTPIVATPFFTEANAAKAAFPGFTQSPRVHFAAPWTGAIRYEGGYYPQAGDEVVFIREAATDMSIDCDDIERATVLSVLSGAEGLWVGLKLKTLAAQEKPITAHYRFVDSPCIVPLPLYRRTIGPAVRLREGDKVSFCGSGRGEVARVDGFKIELRDGTTVLPWELNGVDRTKLYTQPIRRDCLDEAVAAFPLADISARFAECGLLEPVDFALIVERLHNEWYHSATALEADIRAARDFLAHLKLLSPEAAAFVEEAVSLVRSGD